MGIYSEAPLTNDGRGVWLTVTQWGDAVFTGHGQKLRLGVEGLTLAVLNEVWVDSKLTLAILSGMFFFWGGGPSQELKYPTKREKEHHV